MLNRPDIYATEQRAFADSNSHQQPNLVLCSVLNKHRGSLVDLSSSRNCTKQTPVLSVHEFIFLNQPGVFWVYNSSIKRELRRKATVL